jgi:integrase
MRGDGRIYLRGKTYWIGICVDGREQRESARTTDAKEAQKFLRRRLKQAHAHEVTGEAFTTQRDRRRKVSELLDDLAAHFKLGGKGSPQNLSTIKRAKEYFDDFRALSVTSKMINEYIQAKLDAGYANASINRTLQMVGQAYRLAKLPAPRMVRLDESGNVRKGFFEPVQFAAVQSNLSHDLRDFVAFLYATGWRKGEASSLTWQDVESSSIELRAEHSKNGKARSVPLEGELAEIIERRRAARQYKQGQLTQLSEFVFHRDGKPIKEFRKAWATACLLGGVGKLHCRKCDEIVDAAHFCAKCDRKWKREALRYRGRVVHDLRRSGVRDLIRAGVGQAVAMSISGHRTVSMFLRYSISGERDKREALKATQLYRKQQREQPIEVAIMRPN